MGHDSPVVAREPLALLQPLEADEFKVHSFHQMVLFVEESVKPAAWLELAVDGEVVVLHRVPRKLCLRSLASVHPHVHKTILHPANLRQLQLNKKLHFVFNSLANIFK